MKVEDLTIKYGKVRQQTRFDETSTAIEEIIIPIYLGAHGPFTERFTTAEYADGFTVLQRVERLKAALLALPR